MLMLLRMVFNYDQKKDFLLSRSAGLFILMLAITIGPFLAGFGQAERNSFHATFEGVLVCSASDAGEKGGIDGGCSIYGHRHALRTADGRFINFLENKNSEGLINGGEYHNKAMRIHGLYYSDTNLLDVDGFEVNDRPARWCSNHNVMDGCISAK
jgi:hypothetical protein